MHVFGVLTEPGSATAVFSVFGTRDISNHTWLVFRINMTGLLGSKCGSTDYKNWTLRSAQNYFRMVKLDVKKTRIK